jgi:hypothetical protein
VEIDGRPRLGAVRALARELVVVVTFGVTYAGVRELTQQSAAAAERNAEHLLRVERVLGVAWEHSAQSRVLGRHVLVDLVNWMYIWGHWPVIAATAIVLYAARRDRYRLLRNAVIVSGLIGFVFFALFPCAPPRLANVGLVDTISRWSDSYRTLQPPRFTNQFAAMPSLHFGWNLLVGIVLFGTTRSVLVRAFAILMPAAMAFAVVATANHWVLDLVVGVVVVLAGLMIATLVERRSVEYPAAAASASRLLYWIGRERQHEAADADAVSRRAPGGERPGPPQAGGVGRGRRRGRRSSLSRTR